MDSTVKNKSMTQPKTMAELLPDLCGILSKDAVHSLKGKKKPRPTMVQSHTAEKVYKPMTMAEMQAEMMSLKIQSPRSCKQPNNSVRKRNWNSSVKVENKTKSCTADGQMKHKSVRKVLNFQTIPKPMTSRATMICSETPKFPKPEMKAKKSLAVSSKSNIRISGKCIPETPVIANKRVLNRQTIYQHSKENNSNVANLNKKVASPKTLFHKKLLNTKPQTPSLLDLNDILDRSNLSFKSNSDASFLEKEKEINDVEMKTNALTEEPTLENIAKVSPPVSTPFKEYRNVNEFFNQSENECSVQIDNTIMCLDKISGPNEIIRVIVTLCYLLNNAKGTNSNNDKHSKGLEVDEKQILHNIEMLEDGIKILNKIKESQLVTLESVKKLNDEKEEKLFCKTNTDETLISVESNIPSQEICLGKSETLDRPSVIIVKSPSYKIPKKNLCLRKNLFHKSMPSISGMQTPTKNNKALNMYMEIKSQMNFLNTPLVNRHLPVPDTPGITSHNLQTQLDKLYNGS